MTTYLILSHHPLPHIAVHAARHPQAHYYIHHDAQSPRLTGSLTTLPNVHLISHRIRINWGGFTMIEATLALIQAALPPLPPHQRQLRHAAKPRNPRRPMPNAA